MIKCMYVDVDLVMILDVVSVVRATQSNPSQQVRPDRSSQGEAENREVTEGHRVDCHGRRPPTELEGR